MVRKWGKTLRDFNKDKTQKNHIAEGVGIIVKNEVVNLIEAIDPLNDRMISLTLAGKKPITIISTYAFTSNATEDEKRRFYRHLKNLQTKAQKLGPTFTMGDFNARFQKSLNETEQEMVGEHTFDKHFQNVHEQSNEVADNRTRFIAHCSEMNCTIINT